MFGFGKKKNKSDATIDTAVGVLQMQISLGGVEDNNAFSSRLADKYSRGYIFGLCDAILQSARFTDKTEFIVLLTAIHTSLLGEELGTSMLAQSFNDQGNSVFGNGMMKGGQELMEFFQNKTPPMGLATYLLNSEM